jgi:GNAT superfamily N-acetyltransferase
MALQSRWVGYDQAEFVAQTRLRCYSPGMSDLPRMLHRTVNDHRAKEGDFLLVEKNGRPVGTATHFTLRMFVRGAAMPCQGVAWVGTIRTERRKGNPGEPGIATVVMRETINRGRERGDVISALMPFRASFYEHFGYGLIERRTDWTIPMSLLPSGPSDGLRFYEEIDFDAVLACRNRIARSGQCDVERIEWTMRNQLEKAADGFVIVDRPDDRGPVRGWMTLMHEVVDNRRIVKVADQGAEDTPALLRQLHMLGGLKDQYSAAIMTMPADFQINRLLKESQLPHRPVDHAVCSSNFYTRMQARILDHRKFLEAVPLPTGTRGAAIVEIRECEGTTSKFRVEIDSGKTSVKPAAGDATFRCADTTWASVVCGEISGTSAVRMGLAEGDGALFDAFSAGPAPFTVEHF